MLFATGRGPSRADGGKGAAKTAAQESARHPDEMPYEAFFDAIPEAFAIFRVLSDKRGTPRDFVFVTANGAFEQFFDVSDVVGRRASEVNPRIRQGEPDIMAVCKRAAVTGTPERDEVYYPRLDRWVDVRVSCPSKDHLMAVFEDVSERKQTEQALLRAQFSLDRVTDYPIWTDERGRIVEVSGSTCRQLEYSREELLRMTVFDLSPELSLELWAEHWKRTGRSGSSLLETRHRTKNGRVFPVEIAASHVTFADHEYDCGFCRDISERRDTEDALRRTLFSLDHIGDYPLWLDPDGRILEVSESTCRHLEYSRDELLSMTIFDIDPNILDVEATKSAKERAKSWKHYKKLNSFVIETKHRTKNGRVFPVEVSVNFVSVGDLECQCSFCRDISARKQLEQSLSLAQLSVDQSPDLVQWLDSDGRLLFANQATRDLLGYSKAELEMLHIWDIDVGVSPELFHRRWRQGRRTGPIRHEATLRGKDGRMRSVEISTEYVDYEGKEVGVSFMRDITERRRVEESLLLTQVSVDQAADMVHWTDSEGRLVYVNQSIADCLGYSREELQSLHLWDLAPELSREHVLSTWAERAGKGPLRDDGVLKTKDGRLIPVEVSSTSVQLRGRTLAIHSARDTSERREAERLLRESEARYRQLFELESDAILLTDDESGRFLEVNEAATTLYGYSRAELLTMKNTDLSAEPELTRLTLSEPVFDVPLRWHRKKDGTVFMVEGHGRRLEWKGRAVHTVVLRDITEHRHIEESLLLTKLSVDQAADMIHWLDPDGRIVYSNLASCESLGYTLEEMQTMHVWDLDPRLSADSWPQIWAHVAAEAPLLEEAVLRCRDGSQRTVEISSNYVQYEGKEYGVALIRDITERKRIEESLRLTQFSVDNAPDLVHWLDSDGYIVYANRALRERLGYSHEELQGMRIWDLNPGGMEEIFKKTWVLTSEGEVHLHEETMRSKDGQEFVVEVASRRFRHEGKEVEIAFARDVGERKRAEQLLRESEERYRQLFELESDAIVLAEVESRRILEVNGAAASLYGYSRAELLTMKDTDLFADPEQIPRAAGISAGDPARHWHQKKDGTIFPVETRGRRFEWKGQPVRVAAVRDISERKRSEDELEESRQMLQLVLDTVPLRIGWRDRDLRYMGCNAALARGFQLPNPEVIVGLPEEELPLFNTTQSSRDDDREVIATGVPKLQYEESVTTSDGASFVFLTSKVPLRDRSGQIIGVLGVHQDVTERTQTLEALKEREEQLRQSQKMEAVGRLAGGIAHDFNNVLTTIIGYSDLILSSPTCPEGSLAEDIGEIRAAAERAGGLTRRILAFSRRQALQPTVLSLNAVVSDTERLLARTLGADIELRLRLSPDLGSVEVDEQQFVQVLLNLAVNARDAMPKGGFLTLETANVELDAQFCETHPDAHPGPYALLTVSDTGTGMDLETLAHAFEPFYTTKPPGEGTGLGLSTVYGVVAQSGGCTYAASEPGQGTTFTIYFPRVESGAAPQETASSAPAAETGPRTIMVVEDDPVFLGLTARILERRGYQVLPVTDGDQAVAVLEGKATLIDLLLTDIVLPGSLQGDEVARLATDKRPGLPVLFMSGQPRDTMIQAGRITETAAYLERPFTAEELAGRVRTSLSEA